MRRTLPAAAAVIRASLGLELVGDAHEPLPEQCGQLVDDDTAGDVPLVQPPVAGCLHHAGDGMRPDERPGRVDSLQLWLAGDAGRELLAEPAHEALDLAPHGRAPHGSPFAPATG